jgi:lambda family phage portal protein
MNITDKILAPLFPTLVQKRMHARMLIRAYEAAMPSRLHKKRVDRGSGDLAVAKAGDALRIQARYLDENHDLARGILNVLVNNIIGIGIQVEPQVRHSNGELHLELNRQLLALWQDWMLFPEVTGELHWNALQRLAARSWLRDGEVFLQLLEGQTSNLDHRTHVPLSLELIEADLLPLELTEEDQNIIQGVKKDKWGRPQAYFFLKSHDNLSLARIDDTLCLNADQIIHLKLFDRINQTRGVSIFASVLNRLDDIKDYEDSERVAARVAAAMTAYIKKPIDTGYASLNSAEREMKMQPGMIFDNLLPGEEIGLINSSRPNTQLEAFRNAQLRAIAAGTLTSYSSIAKDYNGTYSAQRQELVEQSTHYAVLRDYFIWRFIAPIWKRFVKMSVARGLIQLPNDIDSITVDKADFRGPSMPWIDPLKEIEAEKEAVRAGFKSRSQVIRERGSNPDDTLEQIKHERQQEQANELIFTTIYVVLVKTCMFHNFYYILKSTKKASINVA